MRPALLAALTALAFATPALADEIVPLDGTWTSRAEAIAFSDACPAALTPMLAPMTEAMGSEQTQDVEFGGSFDPSALSDGDQEGLTWTRVDENTWEGEMAAPNDPDTTFARMTLEAIAEDRIEGTMRLDIAQMFEGDPDMAAMGAMAAGCTIDMTMVSTHGG